jgi:hypothetical protein
MFTSYCVSFISSENDLIITIESVLSLVYRQKAGILFSKSTKKMKKAKRTLQKQENVKKQNSSFTNRSNDSTE